MKSMQDNLRE